MLINVNRKFKILMEITLQWRLHILHYLTTCISKVLGETVVDIVEIFFIFEFKTNYCFCVILFQVMQVLY